MCTCDLMGSFWSKYSSKPGIYHARMFIAAWFVSSLPFLLIWRDKKQRKGEGVCFGPWFEGAIHHGREDVVEGSAQSSSNGSFLIAEPVRKQRERCLSGFLLSCYKPMGGASPTFSLTALKASLMTHPELCLLGDPKSSQVDKDN